MKIVVVNVPLREPENPQQWISLPPKGYGGIQWVVTNLLDGYLDLGHQVWLLGAPSTQLSHRRLVVVNVAEPDEIYFWLKTQVQALKIDVIHDHSNGVFQKEGLNLPCPIVTTHHLTGRPKNATYPIYLSKAQRQQGSDQNAPVIRIPVNPKYYTYSENKKDYVLYLGRVSRWKGVYQAAQIAKNIGLKLIVAGPSWEEDYKNQILSDFSQNIHLVGEVGGKRRRELLSQARAVIAFSQAVPGPWGDQWYEPGATVVSEAAASGTAVIASTNGCLKEIAPKVGIVMEEHESLNFSQEIFSRLPSSPKIFENGIKEWNYLKIAQEYVNYFRTIQSSNDFPLEIGAPMLQMKEQLLVEGATVARAILTPELLAKIDTATKKLLQNWESLKDVDKDFWWYREEKLEKNILYRIHNLEKKDPIFSKLIDEPVVEQLRNFIFGRATRPTAFALIYKPSRGSAPVKWHRDPIQVPPNTVYNFSFYLDESDDRNGALEIVPHSHLNQNTPLSEQPENAKIIGAHPGDVIIHDVRVYHGSQSSMDTRMRRSIIVEFQPEEEL